MQDSITGTNSCANRILRCSPAQIWGWVRMEAEPGGLIRLVWARWTFTILMDVGGDLGLGGLGVVGKVDWAGS